MADSAVAAPSAPADTLVAAAQPEMPAPHTPDEDDRLDTPLPAIRAPQPIEDSMAVDANFDVPMVPLRNTSTQEEYLVFERSPSPTLTEPFDEDPDDLEYIPGSGQPDCDRVESTAAGPANDADAFPLPPSTSSHSIRNQSIRSFEARTRKGDTASKSTPTVKVPAVRKTASSATVITRSLSSLSPTESALSGAELCVAAGYIPHYNADKAPEFRKKIVANQEQIIGAVVRVERRVAQVNDEHTDLLKDLIQRIADTQLHTGSASSPLIQNTCAVVDRLRKSVGESRDQISKLTECVNNLMDIPSMVVQLQREIRALPARAAPSHAPRVLAAPSLPANPPSSSHGAIARGRDAQPKPGVGTKRVEREFSPEGAPAAKQQKPLDDFFLVYMWEVKLEKVAPIMWARKALKATGVELSALKNAIHPKNMAKGLISIRFKSHDAGQRFLSRMQNNPPRDMAHLHVATPEAYGKRREQDVPDEDDLSW